MVSGHIMGRMCGLLGDNNGKQQTSGYWSRRTDDHIDHEHPQRQRDISGGASRYHADAANHCSPSHQDREQDRICRDVLAVVGWNRR